MELKTALPSLADRTAEATKVLQAHPTKIPVIIEPRASANVLQQTRFLVPRYYTFHELLFHLRKRMQLKPMSALYITVGNQIPRMDTKLEELYAEFKDADGFLYVKYSTEALLG